MSSAAEAVRSVQSGQRVFVHGAAATPRVLLKALVDRAAELKNVELLHLHLEGAPLHADPRWSDSFRVVNLFVGASMRPFLDYDRVDYLPCFLSEIPSLFRDGSRTPDVALLHVSPPDADGYCSLGVSVDVAKAAFDTAKVVIAQMNRRMPRTHGDGLIHIGRLDHVVEVDEPLPSPTASVPGEIELSIGRHAASLIEDGSCLQIGIGSIPDSILRSLRHHRHLGIHSEMISDGVLELLRCGAVDNSRKELLPGKTVASFVLGSEALYSALHDDPGFLLRSSDFVNNPGVVARNPKVVAINSAVEVDLTGQVCADSVGPRIISGVGGQMDFMRGAALSIGGQALIAVSSRTRKGAPRIVPHLALGAGVVTTRAQVDAVITEHGIAHLRGRTLHERASALVGIAHPDDREFLFREWHRTHRAGSPLSERKVFGL